MQDSARIPAKPLAQVPPANDDCQAPDPIIPVLSLISDGFRLDGNEAESDSSDCSILFSIFAFQSILMRRAARTERASCLDRLD